MRDWMDANLPPWMLGIYDWPRYRFFSRCWVCGRLNVLHTPWALFICERLPMNIAFTEKGEELLRQYAVEDDLPDTDWQLDPAPAASA